MRVELMVYDKVNSGILDVETYEIIAEVTLNALPKEVIEKVKNPSVSLTLTNDEELHKLNKEYRNIDETTDVLSFPTNEDDAEVFEGMLGDIMISVDYAQRVADEYGEPVEREIAFLLTHGIMHLVGYDHEVSEKVENEMLDIQEGILDVLIERDIIA